MEGLLCISDFLRACRATNANEVEQEKRKENHARGVESQLKSNSVLICCVVVPHGPESQVLGKCDDRRCACGECGQGRSTF